MAATGGGSNGFDEDSAGQSLPANATMEAPRGSNNLVSETTAAYQSRSTPRAAASWLHADLSDTHGMPRRSGGLLSSRGLADILASPPSRQQHPHYQGLPRRCVSEIQHRVVGFDSPSAQPQQVSHHSLPRPATDRPAHTNSVLTAVAEHLHRLDPSRPKPTPRPTFADPPPGGPDSFRGHPPTAATAADPAGYVAVVQQIKERLDIDAHSLPYPEAPSIDASSLTHTPFVTPPHGAAAKGSSLAACSPPDQPLPALSGLASPPPVPDKQPEPDGRSHSGALGSPPAAAVQVPPLPLRHSSSVEEPLLEEPKVEGASWLHTGAPGATLLEEAEPPGSLANDITVGVINVIIALPVSVAFASVMYSHPAFAAVLPQLSRLLVLANSAHQLVATLMSALPVAVGQVQDLGLIFLNAMTSDIAEVLRDEPHEKIVGTAMAACALSTIVLGLSLVLFGRFKLAAITSYIPLPVVAGYLGYVGYFCLTAGVAQATALPIHGPASWLLLLSHTEAWVKLVVTAAAVTLVFYSVNVWRTPIALPATLVAIPILWYAVRPLLCLWWGVSWADASAELVERDWVMPVPAGHNTSFWEVFKLFNLAPFAWGNIGWLALVAQAPKLLALVLMCAFGTSMDIMAVQAEVSEEIDTDWEVMVIGWSNVFAGIFGGGGTGSYIFSQCLLAIRSGVRTRAQGATVSAMQLLVFMLPFALVQLLPNFYYGSLLIVIGADVMHEWLVATRRRVKCAEFFLSWLAFFSTVTLSAIFPIKGLEAGLLVGIVACSLHFAYEYSVMQLVEFSVVPSRSHVMLPFRHQQVLGLFQRNLVAVSVSGYLFFGSMVEISRRLREMAAELGEATPMADRLHAVGLTGLEPAAEAAAASAVAAARRFLLLDLRHVMGIDATTASSFASLRRSLESRGVLMVLTGLAGHESVQRMLVANGVVAADGSWESGRGCPAFESMDAAMVWCEEHFKQVAALCGLLDDLAAQALTLPDVLGMHLDAPMLDALAPSPHALSDVCFRLESYVTRVRYKRGVVLFEHGHEADTMYIVLSGAVASVVDLLRFSEADAFPAWNERGEVDPVGVPRLQSMHMHSLVPRGGTGSSSISRRLSSRPSAAESSNSGAFAHVPGGRGGGKVRIVQAGPGALLGALDYTLRRRRSFQCLVTADASVLRLERSAHERMARHDPAATAALQQIMLRSALTTTAHAMATFERAAHA